MLLYIKRECNLLLKEFTFCLGPNQPSSGKELGVVVVQDVPVENKRHIIIK